MTEPNAYLDYSPDSPHFPIPPNYIGYDEDYDDINGNANGGNANGGNVNGGDVNGGDDTDSDSLSPIN